MRPDPPNIGTNIPAFLSKLWKMVNDPDTNHVICWGPGGHSFVILNQALFWYNMLPIYYKHNNMSSFIRQLNMYGFHKMASESNGLDSEKDEIKFFHPYFQKDQPNLMKHIKRKIAAHKNAPVPTGENKNIDQISKVLVDVKQLRGRQESVDTQLAAMKQENAALWRELALLRQKHLKQQQIVNKLIHFLVTIVQPSRSGLGGLGVKRRYPLMINDSRDPKVSKSDHSSEGPTIHELDPEVSLPDTTLSDNMQSKPVMTEQTENIDSPLSSNPTGSPQVLLDIPIMENNDDMVVALSPDEILIDSNVEENEDNQVANLLAESNLETNNSFSLNENDLEGVITDKDILEVANDYVDLENLKMEQSSTSLFDSTSSKEITGGKNITSNMQDSIFADIPSTINISGKIDNFKSKEENKCKTVATRDTNVKVDSANTLDTHLEATQGELDTIKEMLFEGYTLDPSTLCGLFTPDDVLPIDVPQIHIPETGKSDSDSNVLLSGSEIMTYNPPDLIDFDNLFEDSSDNVIESSDEQLGNVNNINDEVTTPIILKKEPAFPKIKSSKK